MTRQNKPYCKDTLTTVEQNDKSSVKKLEQTVSCTNHR